MSEIKDCLKNVWQKGGKVVAVIWILSKRKTRIVALEV